MANGGKLRRPFQSIGIKMRSLGRGLMRFYFGARHDIDAPPALPPPSWQRHIDTPLEWSSPSSSETAPVVQRMDAETPAFGETGSFFGQQTASGGVGARPARTPVPSQPTAKAQRQPTAPAPSTPAQAAPGAQPAPQVQRQPTPAQLDDDARLSQIMAFHRRRAEEQERTRKERLQKMQAAPDVQTSAAESSEQVLPRRRRGASFEYIETSALRSDESVPSSTTGNSPDISRATAEDVQQETAHDEEIDDEEDAGNTEPPTAPPLNAEPTPSAPPSENIHRQQMPDAALADAPAVDLGMGESSEPPVYAADADISVAPDDAAFMADRPLSSPAQTAADVVQRQPSPESRQDTRPEHIQRAENTPPADDQPAVADDVADVDGIEAAHDDFAPPAPHVDQPQVQRTPQTSQLVDSNTMPTAENASDGAVGFSETAAVEDAPPTAEVHSSDAAPAPSTVQRALQETGFEAPHLDEADEVKVAGALSEPAAPTSSAVDSSSVQRKETASTPVEPQEGSSAVDEVNSGAEQPVPAQPTSAAAPEMRMIQRSPAVDDAPSSEYVVWDQLPILESEADTQPPHDTALPVTSDAAQASVQRMPDDGVDNAGDSEDAGDSFFSDDEQIENTTQPSSVVTSSPVAETPHTVQRTTWGTPQPDSPEHAGDDHHATVSSDASFVSAAEPTIQRAVYDAGFDTAADELLQAASFNAPADTLVSEEPFDNFQAGSVPDAVQHQAAEQPDSPRQTSVEAQDVDSVKTTPAASPSIQRSPTQPDNPSVNQGEQTDFVTADDQPIVSATTSRSQDTPSQVVEGRWKVSGDMGGERIARSADVSSGEAHSPMPAHAHDHYGGEEFTQPDFSADDAPQADYGDWDEASAQDSDAGQMDLYQALVSAGAIPPVGGSDSASYVQRAPASQAKVPDANSTEADLLKWLNLPPNTPVVGSVYGDQTQTSAPSSPASSSAPIQRAVTSAPTPQPSTAGTTETTESSETQEEDGEEINVDKLARDVYSLLRNRLRIERERRRSK